MLQSTRLVCFKGFDGSRLLGSLLGKNPGCGKGEPCSRGFGNFSFSSNGFGFGSTFGGVPATLREDFFGGTRGDGSSKGGTKGAGDHGSTGGSGSGPFGGTFGLLFDKALEWCSEAHARDIARRQGIDLRDIRFEKTPEGGMTVVVDAPNATPKQIEHLGEQVMEECPVARFRKSHVTSQQQRVNWVRLPDRYDR